MWKKYKFTSETIQYDGRVLHRIIAVRDFGNVKKGNLGGFIENENCLSHEGECWVSGIAMVYNEAKVDCNAYVSGRAIVRNKSYITDDTKVNGECIIDQESTIYGKVHVISNAKIYNSSLDKDIIIAGNANIEGSFVYGEVNIIDNVVVHNSTIHGIRVNISNDAKIINTVMNESQISLGHAAVIKSNRDYLKIGPLGSRRCTCTFYNTEHGIFVKTGCFNENIGLFINKVNRSYGADDSDFSFYRETYLTAAEYAKTYFRVLKKARKDSFYE